jgi:hypothetical protein
MKYLGILAIAGLMASCATSQEIVLPSGETGFTVNCGTYEGNSWSACYKKAGEMCPSGYDILEKSESSDKNVIANQYSFQTLDDDKRTLLIECKQESK